MLKRVKEVLYMLLVIGCVCYTFSLRIDRATGDTQRTYDTAYLKGYREGRKEMCEEFEQRMKTITHAKKIDRHGYQIAEEAE